MGEPPPTATWSATSPARSVSIGSRSPSSRRSTARLTVVNSSVEVFRPKLPRGTTHLAPPSSAQDSAPQPPHRPARSAPAGGGRSRSVRSCSRRGVLHQPLDPAATRNRHHALAARSEARRAPAAPASRPSAGPWPSSSSTSSRFFSKLSPWNRGFVRRQSSGARSSTLLMRAGQESAAQRAVGDEGDARAPRSGSAARPPGRESRASTPSAAPRWGGPRAPAEWSPGAASDRPR